MEEKETTQKRPTKPKMNITLVGFMGTGKSIVGKQLAKKLNMRYVDTDEVVERHAGMTVAKLFSRYGENYFRALERRAVRAVFQLQNYVISAGGGVVLQQCNIDNLKRCGAVICLTAAPEEIYERVKGETHRPLLQVADPLSRIKDLLQHRAPFYAQADFTIETSGKTPEKIVKEIEDCLKKFKKKEWKEREKLLEEAMYL